MGGTASDKIVFKHPVVFPERLAEEHILSWSNKEDLIFNPMCGSGTNGKIDLKHGREFIGVDISKDYIDIAKQRIKNCQIWYETMIIKQIKIVNGYVIVVIQG